MNKKTSLKDIARIAGVSMATVSYALNGSSEVSQKTQEKIKSIAKELNYKPNKAAQGLRTQKSNIICMLINTFTGIFNGELVDDIRQELSKHGYSLVVIGQSDAKLINSQLFDALIIFNYTRSQRVLLSLLKQTDIPTILMANEVRNSEVASIVLDNDRGMRELVTLFARSKHQNPCILTGPEGSYNSDVRLKSCIKYLTAFNPQLDFRDRIFDCDFKTSNAHQLGDKLLKETPFDFFFCLNDAMAYGIFQAAKSFGRQIGKDLSVVGFDNNLFYHEHYPQILTTIDPQIKIWGKSVVNALLQSLVHDQFDFKTHYSPVKIINGKSIAFQ